jgi:hypothetical protein
MYRPVPRPLMLVFPTRAVPHFKTLLDFFWPPMS